MRVKKNSQFAKFGSIKTFRFVNWIKNDAWPIQVMATWPWISFGKTGRRCRPIRRVSSAFQISSRKNVRGLKCFDGVKSLKERGNFRRGGAGRCETGFVIRHWYFKPCSLRKEMENHKPSPRWAHPRTVPMVGRRCRDAQT